MGTERVRAQTSGWLHVEGPGQSGHLYLKEGDQATITFQPDGGEEG